MKKIISLFLCTVMTVSMLATAAFAESGLSNYKKSLTYTEGKFTDVASADWFNKNVSAAYEYNLMQGMSSNYFGASENVRLCEVIAMAARLNSIYTTGSANFTQASPWYQTYVDYAVANSIISKTRFENYEAYATRFQVAEIFAAALPSSVLTAINSIKVGNIPDVSLETPYECVYTLYNAGVLTGKSGSGNFYPAEKILRSEMSAVVTRMADTSLRVQFTIDTSTPEDVSSALDPLKEVKSAQDMIMTSLQYYASAETLTMSSAAAASGLLVKANEYALMAATTTQSVAAYCKTNTKYSAAYDNINAAQLGCVEASVLISELAKSPSISANWSAAESILSGCSESLSKAETTISSIG